MKNPKPIPEICPHCGSDGGYFRKGTVSGTYVYRYTPDGVPGDNTHMHDGIRYHEKKTAYCQDCERAIGRVK